MPARGRCRAGRALCPAELQELGNAATLPVVTRRTARGLFFPQRRALAYFLSEANQFCFVQNVSGAEGSLSRAVC